MKKKQKNKIAIDLMGSHHPAQVLMEEIFRYYEKFPKGYSFLLIATEENYSYFEKLQKEYSLPHIEFLKAQTAIEMEENPLVAVRRKKNSSIAMGMNLLKEKRIEAFVSAGNTGALLTSAIMNLDLLPHITRPGLMALFPTKKEPIVVVDVGANVSCTADMLVQFALLGACFQKLKKKKIPKVALLNIGSEEIKGTKELKHAYKLLQETAKKRPDFFSFYGNIEGKDIFDGEIDVLVTEGFTGNVFLKTSEGIASYILDHLHETIAENQFTHLEKSLQDLNRHLHYEQYPGALIIGLQSLVIKCHGYSSPHAVMNAIRGAIEYSQNNLISSLKNQIVSFSKV